MVDEITTADTILLGLPLYNFGARFITVELTLANLDPAMAELLPGANLSLAEAERAIDNLWTPVPSAI